MVSYAKGKSGGNEARLRCPTIHGLINADHQTLKVCMIMSNQCLATFENLRNTTFGKIIISGERMQLKIAVIEILKLTSVRWWNNKGRFCNTIASVALMQT